MSTSSSVRSRLERYTIMASVPTVGIMGSTALAGGDEDSEVRGFLSFIADDDGSEIQMCGWLDIGWDGDLLTIYDYAFILNDSIEAGQTSSSTAVPGAGGLAALAMGAAGLRRRRKKSA